jgi:hypothetical protein
VGVVHGCIGDRRVGTLQNASGLVAVVPQYLSKSSGAGSIVLQFRTGMQEKTLETECRVPTASPTMALIPASLAPPYRADFGTAFRRR